MDPRLLKDFLPLHTGYLLLIFLLSLLAFRHSGGLDLPLGGLLRLAPASRRTAITP